MKKLKLSIVSYVNTLPFIYGLERSSIVNEIDIKKDTPAECAKKITSGAADIGLVPVVMLSKHPNLKRISNYCIGSKSKVDSVCLLSQVPLNKIQKIHLDYQSLTSVNLVQILCEKYWNITPQFSKTEPGFEDTLPSGDAAVIIGNRCFDVKSNFTYCYDLSEEWNNFTNLPFVFACWVSNKPIDKIILNKLNKAFEFGIEDLENVISESSQYYPNIDLAHYLCENIAFELDENMKKGMDLFIKYYKSHTSFLDK